ncbi:MULTISPECIES: phosphosulfolactate synthase [unclassified Brenneria]|uniref:phosphosulfolactate synthase n=1 Tax=unclassified Brenneria TaxID=2634434 RepID=UPI0029C245F1|nr:MULTISPECIES: phosphosulfolactate synthase [unclassified Brenneria]MDX5629431.1 phosphosulfolactate synthase [Brenneria sp. L3-3Z]MDX5696570.1 phosphosulfolactate synthase [Brenneria sp. L4-2C]MEE3663395.1 phosphosulfolactate synthase [Brenneria sp. g21c3]
MTRALDFITIAPRSVKPRKAGYTIARDLGLGYERIKNCLEDVAQFVDFIKIRHISALKMTHAKDDPVRRKIDLYLQNDIQPFAGGIVFELAYAQGQAERVIPSLADLGFTAIELSENFIQLTSAEREKYISLAKKAGLFVFSELGGKYPEQVLSVAPIVKDMKEVLSMGADLVTLEGGELDNALGKQAEKETGHLILELVDQVGYENITFEAEEMKQQAWLVNNISREVNIGPNLDIHERGIVMLEPIRLGLSTGYVYLTDLLQKNAAQANDR